MSLLNRIAVQNEKSTWAINRYSDWWTIENQEIGDTKITTADVPLLLFAREPAIHRDRQFLLCFRWSLSCRHVRPLIKVPLRPPNGFINIMYLEHTLAIRYNTVEWFGQKKISYCFVCHTNIEHSKTTIRFNSMRNEDIKMFMKMLLNLCKSSNDISLTFK